MSDPTSEAIRAEVARLQTDNAQLSARIVHQRNLIEDADKVIRELESQKLQLRALLDEAGNGIEEILAALKDEQIATNLERETILLELKKVRKSEISTCWFIWFVIIWVAANIIAYFWNRQ